MLNNTPDKCPNALFDDLSNYEYENVLNTRSFHENLCQAPAHNAHQTCTKYSYLFAPTISWSHGRSLTCHLKTLFAKDFYALKIAGVRGNCSWYCKSRSFTCVPCDISIRATPRMFEFVSFTFLMLKPISVFICSPASRHRHFLWFEPKCPMVRTPARKATTRNRNRRGSWIWANLLSFKWTNHHIPSHCHSMQCVKSTARFYGPQILRPAVFGTVWSAPPDFTARRFYKSLQLMLI